jgi:hypothetical protein
MMEFYGFTRKNNSSVVITIPSKLNILPDTQVKIIIEKIDNKGFYSKDTFEREEECIDFKSEILKPLPRGGDV